MSPRSPVRWDVIVVGAGPVGLFAANLLGRAGLETLVVEASDQPDIRSRAIGVMPPSLEMAAAAGLADDLVEAGVRVTRAVVHGDGRALGAVAFDRLPAPYPFILALPQHRTETVLAKGLARFDCVTVRQRTTVTAVEGADCGHRVLMRSSGDAGAATSSETARFVLACDGDRSTVRPGIGLGLHKKGYRQTFLMGDFADQSGLGAEAHLFFTRDGAVESFPLTPGFRRWIVETPAYAAAPGPGDIVTRVRERAGYLLSEGDCDWVSPFGIKAQLAERYFAHGVLLAGDAAHVMPPIGGQGMNTGFADAWMAAALLVSATQRPSADPAPLFELYESCRRRAARRATRRALLAMRIGTIKGRWGSRWRNRLVRWGLENPAIRRWIPPHFAMWTLPCGTACDIDRALAARLPAGSPTSV